MVRYLAIERDVVLRNSPLLIVVIIHGVEGARFSFRLTPLGQVPFVASRNIFGMAFVLLPNPREREVGIFYIFIADLALGEPMFDLLSFAGFGCPFGRQFLDRLSEYVFLFSLLESCNPFIEAIHFELEVCFGFVLEKTPGNCPG